MKLRKLHLGSGKNIIRGWDNLDFNPPRGAIYTDLRKPLSYVSNSVSHIFSEHFLEHLDEVQGFKLLKECYRVLAEGGHIRIGTPDLALYVDSYLNWKPRDFDGDLFADGVVFINYAMLGEASGTSHSYIGKLGKAPGINHRFIYDFNHLKGKLEKIGFKKVKRVEHRSSEIPEFDKLEFHGPRRDLIIEAEK